MEDGLAVNLSANFSAIPSVWPIMLDLGSSSPSLSFNSR